MADVGKGTIWLKSKKTIVGDHAGIRFIYSRAWRLERTIFENLLGDPPPPAPPPFGPPERAQPKTDLHELAQGRP